MAIEQNTELESIEIRLLLEGVYQHYGYDFRDYAPSTIHRQLTKCLRQERLSNFSALQERVLHDPEAMKRLLWNISVTTTSLFRDPEFYCVFRERVVPLLRTYPFVRVWHAGCSTGEEVFSMAILLMEENLYERSRIYATDFHEAVLEKAKSRAFPLRRVPEFMNHYLEAGGKKNLSDYYTIHNDDAVFIPALARNIVFAQHNLVTDDSFMEFNVILCRNVLIYFNNDLLNRAHKLIYQSLAMFGILSLGKKESIQFTGREPFYKTFDQREKLYQKIK